MEHFFLNVGEISGGHGTAPLCVTEKTVTDVRNAHFAIKERLGINLETLCSEPGDDVMPSTVFHQLQKLDYPFLQDFKDMDGTLHFREPSGMVRLWLFLLNASDPALEAALAPFNGQDLLFEGVDEQGRICRPIGRGLYSEQN